MRVIVGATRHQASHIEDHPAERRFIHPAQILNSVTGRIFQKAELVQEGDLCCIGRGYRLENKSEHKERIFSRSNRI